MLFESQRLVGRILSLEDIDPMLAIYGDLETVRFVGDSTPITREGCIQWIEVTDRNFDRRGYGMIALCHKLTGELIGCAGIVHPDQQEEPEVKYAFRRDCWGQGFATEAIGALISFARSEWGIKRVIATVAPSNHPSQHVLAKLGFNHVNDQTNEDASITQVWANEA